ncbi:MAG TPA: hypothetical protein VGI40_04820, partial [Pirellulaceae bacterium]
MPLLPNQEPRSSATTLLVFLIGLPLIGLVAAVFVAAMRIPIQPASESDSKVTNPPVAAPPVDHSGSAPAPTESRSVTEPAAPATSNETEKAARPSTPAEPKIVGSPRPSETERPPWQGALDDSTDAPGYEQIAFQSFDEAFGKPGRDDLTPWFAATSAAGFRISKVPSQFGQSGMIEGIGRLKCPWPEGAVLRLQVENFDGLKMHFWNGSAGVTLVYADEGNRWTAYKTTREQNEPIPKSLVIAATDDDRCRRSGFRFGGPIELRYVNDGLLLS